MTTLAKRLKHVWWWAACRPERILSIPRRDTAAVRAMSCCIAACETDRDPLAICPRWSALMASAQHGDRAAYRRLLTEIADLVRCWRRRSGMDGRACEALVCNVLRTLHRVRHTYQPSRPFMPWLLSVLRYEVGKQGYSTQDVLCGLSACADIIGQTAESTSDSA